MVNVKKPLFLLILALTLASSNAIAANPDWVVQNKKITPGMTNKNVTQANISTTICKSGWTTTIRPITTYTNNLKNIQLKTTYASYTKIWGTNPSAYEEDHLISLQLGGDPSDPKNLWPQPYANNGARQKDIVETKLKRLVCDGTITLKTAQTAIAKNWVLAYNKYVTSKDTAIEAVN
jgi:hypothetical protein